MIHNPKFKQPTLVTVTIAYRLSKAPTPYPCLATKAFRVRIFPDGSDNFADQYQAWIKGYISEGCEIVTSLTTIIDKVGDYGIEFYSKHDRPDPNCPNCDGTGGPIEPGHRCGLCWSWHGIEKWEYFVAQSKGVKS